MTELHVLNVSTVYFGAVIVKICSLSEMTARLSSSDLSQCTTTEFSEPVVKYCEALWFSSWDTCGRMENNSLRFNTTDVFAQRRTS